MPRYTAEDLGDRIEKKLLSSEAGGICVAALCSRTRPPSPVPGLDTADVITKQIDSPSWGLSILGYAPFHSWELSLCRIHAGCAAESQPTQPAQNNAQSV